MNEQKVKMEVEMTEGQLHSFYNLCKAFQGAHFINIVVRKGGKDITFEADWLKNADYHVEPKGTVH
jgi:hypothetical protein